MKKKEPTYSVTPKGILYLETLSDARAEKILNALELAARRQDKNAILLTGSDGVQFIHVSLEGDK